MWVNLTPHIHPCTRPCIRRGRRRPSIPQGRPPSVHRTNSPAASVVRVSPHAYITPTARDVVAPVAGVHARTLPKTVGRWHGRPAARHPCVNPRRSARPWCCRQSACNPPTGNSWCTTGGRGGVGPPPYTRAPPSSRRPRRHTGKMFYVLSRRNNRHYIQILFRENV